VHRQRSVLPGRCSVTKQDTEHGMSQNQVTKPVTKHCVKITTKITDK
jgi:hypothetical protein